MKPLSLIIPAVFAVALTACNQASAQGSDAAKLNALEKKVTELESNLEAVAFILERKAGMSIEDAKKEMEEANKVWDIPVDDSPVFGNTTNPKLTIVEFTEFQCPYCSRIAPVVKDLMDKHANEIQFVYKHFPLSFHANAPAAAAASIAAQKQGKFWEFRYALAPHNRELTDSVFVEVAKQVGLNVEQFNKDRVLDDAMLARINKDFELGAKVGVQGTPNFYINGKRQDRFSPDLVEKMLKEAK